jgi:V8-like Glu-specific endopeptidase
VAKRTTFDVSFALGLGLFACGESRPPAPVTPAIPTAPPPPSALAPATPKIAVDEGMWLLNDFPSKRVAEQYGFEPNQAWLDHIRLSSVRLAGGCSGSIVSPTGLVMTNHHCAHDCIQQLSTAKKDFVQSGFSANTEKDEVRCPDIEINQLTGISDVTDRMGAATNGKTGTEFNVAQKAEQSRIEKECATSDDVRCDIVSLYHGGRFHLYKYRRFQDVRLVFAPEFDIAFFGGDPDNFNFPRYDLDVSFLRIWKGDKPAATPDYFRWSAAGAKEGDLTFVSGHPGSTSRDLALSQLAFLRDVLLPERIARLSEFRGELLVFAEQGVEKKRISGETLFLVENSLKAYKGQLQALSSREVWRSKAATENELRDRVAATPELAQRFGAAWDAVERAEARKAELHKAYWQLEVGWGFCSDLFDHARKLIRVADELPKPNADRLPEYTDAQLPSLKQATLSTAPIYKELEMLTLAMSLRQLREALGADYPVVRNILGTKSPEDVAKSVVLGSMLGDQKVRKALLDGGKRSIDASTDPMIALAKLVDPDARAIRKSFEDEVEAVEKENSEKIAKARFAVYGTSLYPDATFSLRLSYGQVKGWNEAGKLVTPVTTFGGAFERATGSDPFKLPRSWLDAKVKLELSTLFNMSTTNDIVGGNSGSPIVNKDAEIVGLIFDGNIHSLGGDFAYDPRDNRAVAVESTALVEALGKIYGATRIHDEILAGPSSRK